RTVAGGRSKPGRHSNVRIGGRATPMCRRVTHAPDGRPRLSRVTHKLFDPLEPARHLAVLEQPARLLEVARQPVGTSPSVVDRREVEVRMGRLKARSDGSERGECGPEPRLGFVKRGFCKGDATQGALGEAMAQAERVAKLECLRGQG